MRPSLLRVLFGLTAVLSASQPAFAGTWKNCFTAQSDAAEFVASLEDFNETRIAARLAENKIFKNSALNLSDLKNLFGEPKHSKPIGSQGDVILEWVPTSALGYSATEVQPEAGKYCAYISVRTVNNQLLATIDTQGNIVYRETRKQQVN